MVFLEVSYILYAEAFLRSILTSLFRDWQVWDLALWEGVFRAITGVIGKSILDWDPGIRPKIKTGSSRQYCRSSRALPAQKQLFRCPSPAPLFSSFSRGKGPALIVISALLRFLPRSTYRCCNTLMSAKVLACWRDKIHFHTRLSLSRLIRMSGVVQPQVTWAGAPGPGL